MPPGVTSGCCRKGSDSRCSWPGRSWRRPSCLLLDEPAAGLDLGARERLLTTLATLAGDPSTPPVVLVTHHMEEIPPGITHGALMRSGRLVAKGPVDRVLTSKAVSDCFGVSVSVRQTAGRRTARAVGAQGGRA